MFAVTLPAAGQPLVAENIAVPIPKAHEVLIKVVTCGLCRRDVHIIDGDLPLPRVGLVPD